MQCSQVEAKSYEVLTSRYVFRAPRTAGPMENFGVLFQLILVFASIHRSSVDFIELSTECVHFTYCKANT